MEKKIYADKDIDNDFGGSCMDYICFPRRWNPLFWIAVLLIPTIYSFQGAYYKVDKTSRIASFFKNLSESAGDMSRFFHRYKI